MSSEIRCPDCGGILGAPASSPNPCVCVVVAPAKAADFKPAPAPVEPEAANGKHCYRCGKDVTGQKRFREEQGYLCAECVDAEKSTVADDGLVRCSHCSRRFTLDKILPLNELKLCKNCYRTHIKDTEKKLRKLGGQRVQKLHERAGLWKMVGVVAVLVLLILMNRAGCI